MRWRHGVGRVQATGEPISFELLTQSASSSAQATTGRFSFDISMSFPGADEPFALSGEGAFDTTNERASFAVDMFALTKLLGGFVAGFGGAGAKDLPDFDDPAGWKIEVVQDGDVAYVKFPAIDDQLPEGKTWVRGTAGDVKTGGFDFKELDSFTQNDPRDVLRALRGLSGDIEILGTEELGGVDTTHYRVVLDPVALAKRATAGNPDATSLLGQLTGRNDIAMFRSTSGSTGTGSCGSCRWTSRRTISRAVSPEASHSPSSSGTTASPSRSTCRPRRRSPTRRPLRG